MKKSILPTLIPCLFVLLFFSNSGQAAEPPTQVLIDSYQRFLGTPPETKKTRTFTLTAKESQLAIGKGNPTEVWAYNNQVPGPILRVNRGDDVTVNFNNQLPQATTIHWHGVRVPNNMDGVPMVTQNPVAPGKDFTYQFRMLDSGTYWFHPHLRSHEQVERGLYGVLIVESPEDPVYDQEWVWVLDDWLLTPQGAIEESFSQRELDSGGRLGNLLTINGKEQPNFTARAGERIRIRIINASNARNYRLDFGDARSEIFAVDGNQVGRTQSVKAFDIAPGNRIDVDLTIPIGAEGTVINVANEFFHREARGSVSPGPQTLASVNIVGQVDSKKVFAVPTRSDVPEWQSAYESTVDFSYDFNSSINWSALWDGGPFSYYVINGKRYGEHKVTQLKYGQFYHLRFTNGTGLYHPIHLHGMFFKVLSRNGVKVDEPYFRDTALLDYNGSIEIGIVPVDVGKWMLHCHLLEHSALGMMTLVEVRK